MNEASLISDSLRLPILLCCFMILVAFVFFVGFYLYFKPEWELLAGPPDEPIELEEDPIAAALSFGGSWTDVVEDRAWL